jgi:predicted DCC family thiol-disulfide oxidoreductase YuxK
MGTANFVAPNTLEVRLNDGGRRVRLIYDGACIFCAAYVRLLSLREAVGPVELIDARSGDPRLRAYESAGFDLNEGMLFEYNGTVYFGADTVNALASLSTPVSTFNRINGVLLSKRPVARVFYPIFKFCRTITLKLRRVPKISGPNTTKTFHEGKREG